MKIEKQIKTLAKNIVASCKKDGFVDQTTLFGFVKTLSESEESIAQEILAEIEKVISNEERENTLFVESAFEIKTESLEKIKNYFESREDRQLTLSFSINKDIIGGLKLKLGDFVWEKSIQSNLENLKGNLSL